MQVSNNMTTVGFNATGSYYGLICLIRCGFVWKGFFFYLYRGQQTKSCHIQAEMQY